MTLVVDNKHINKGFIPFIKKKLFAYMSTITDTKKLHKYDELFHSKEFLKMSNNTIISSRQVIVMGMTNLIHKRYETNTQIFINPNINYPGTNLRIVDLCKIINYGNMSIDGYPILTMTFDYVQSNIGKYIDRYTTGLG